MRGYKISWTRRRRSSCPGRLPAAEAVPKDSPPTRAGQWRDPLSALWGDWSGGANPNLSQPAEVTAGISENAQPIAGSSAVPRDSTSVLLEVLARSMTQLQDMQTKTLQKGLEEDILQRR